MVRLFDKACNDVLYRIDNRWANKKQTGGKPNGIWFSQDNQWNKMHDYSYKYTMHLELKNDLSIYNILHVDMSNHEELLSFIRKYKQCGYNFRVDWNKVANKYDGIFMDKVKGIPSSYYKLYNSVDGCWILSLDVDSLCIWRWDDSRSFRLYCLNPLLGHLKIQV